MIELENRVQDYKRELTQLKNEVNMKGRKVEKWQPGDRAPVVRPNDNLKPHDAEFHKRETKQWHAGERAAVIKHQDNLSLFFWPLYGIIPTSVSP